MRNIKKSLLIGAMLLTLPASMAQAQANKAPDTGLPASVQSHVDAAYRILNGEVSPRSIPGLIYSINPEVFPPPVPASRKMENLPATKAFDQFYYLGVNWVNAWALNTPDGIILFDTLTNTAEAEQYIEGGLRKVGLDPANIKYIVITHGHGDHFGGAKYLQEKYKARVMMSDIDWDAVLKPGGANVPPPARDMSITEGQKLTLGGTTVSFTLTPGHTPGTVSMIFPVTDKGRKHVVSFIGGTGLTQPTNKPTAVLNASLTKFAQVSKAAGADVLISSHPFNDDAWDKAKVVIDGKAGAPSPWVSGVDGVQRYYAAAVEGVLAIEAHQAMKPAAPAAAH